MIILALAIPSVSCLQKNAITVFAGSVSKIAIEETALLFEEQTGIKVYLNSGGSGALLSQMKLSHSGDLYIPGSPDYMTTAGQDGVIIPESVHAISYLIPAILVPHNNPKNIETLTDLAKPEIKIGIANPESVSIGLYAYEILEYNDLLSDVGKNIVTYGDSYAKTFGLLAFGSVDAIIGWDIFAKWNRDTTDIIYLKPEQLPRISYISVALSTFSQNPENARKFLDFLVSSKGQEIFHEWEYITTESEARIFTPEAKIGGEYHLPASYEPLVN